MKNKIYFYTRECSQCGNIFPTTIVAPLRRFFEENNLELVIKQITLFDGWRMEASSICEKAKIEVPFFLYQDKTLQLKDTYTNGEIEINNLKNLIS